MKLCIVSRKVVKGDGQSRVNYEIVREALRRGHQVTVLASGVAPELRSSDRLTWVEVRVDRWPTELLKGMAFSWQSASWLQQHRQDFDVIKVNGANTVSPADANAIHFVHSSWLRSPVHPSRSQRNLAGAYQWLYTALNAYWEKKALSQAKVVVAVSDRVKQQAIALGIPAERIRTILNGVDLQEFAPGLASRPQLGLPEAVTLALFAGDIRSSRKNLDTVLYALTEVPQLHLVVVGDRSGSPYPELAAKLGLSDRVHFLGYRPDISEIMKAVDLFVFPSRYEPFGMVVSEAMASGLPVIITATAGAAEIVTPECGLVLPESEDAGALAAAMRTLANNKEMRIEMGRVGRLIVEGHSWESKAQNYLDLLEELARPS
ncbi:MAG: glycosyltransferase family 4 protein [Cyanosarcina radialis HA8281-LM2]|jgi:glycosyltransferase involved in cell wall biosynthesis|nr:glycosyltransferase family 4 protein [Cyanosarcina radialis HA8281-LM2]